jgi:hypothetical protein
MHNFVCAVHTYFFENKTWWLVKVSEEVSWFLAFSYKDPGMSFNQRLKSPEYSVSVLTFHIYLVIASGSVNRYDQNLGPKSLR